MRRSKTHGREAAHRCVAWYHRAPLPVRPDPEPVRVDPTAPRCAAALITLRNAVSVMTDGNKVGPRNTSRRRPRPAIGLTIALLVAPLTATAADAPGTAPPAVESVVVTARKLNVETLIDRKVYSLESDLQSAFGTVSDVLTAIPSIDVDTDGVVSLRGDSNVLILVDGKPSPLFSGPSAGDNLQSIPAKDIERIEVITNPPAQFKADGTAGVINIITRKHHDEGTTGSVQASLGSGGRSMVGGNVSHTSGPLSVTLNATYRHDVKVRLLQSDLTAVDPLTGQPTHNTSVTHETIRRSNPPIDLSVRYAFNEHQSLNASLTRTGRAGLRTYTQLNDGLAPDNSLLEATQRLSTGHDREVIVDSKLGFTQLLARAGETVEVSLHHSGSTESEHYDYSNQSLLPAAPGVYNNFGFHDESAESEAGLDYVLPLSKTRKFKAGGSFEQEDYLYRAAGYTIDPLSAAPVENLLLRDEFVHWRQIVSLYATLQTTLGAWSALGGVRAEYSRAEGRQLTVAVATATHEFALYPSLHVERSLSEQSTLSFGASRRVTRPDPGSLDPYVDREYLPNLYAGNPNLRPQYTQSYEAGYAYEGGGWSGALTGYYRHNLDSTTLLIQNLGNGVTLQTHTNLPRNDSSGFEFSSTGRLLPKLVYSVSGNAFYAQIDATALGTPGLRSTTGINGKLKLDWRPSATDSAQISVNRNDRRLTPQGSVGAFTVTNLGWRHVLRPTLTAVATLSDAFNGQRYARSSTTPTFVSQSLRMVRGRVLYVGLVQTFGTSRKEKPGSFEYDP